MANTTWTSNHTKLREELAGLYPDQDDTQRVCTEALIDVTEVKFGGSAANNWFAAIQKADSQGKLVQLIEQALVGHKGNKVLNEALDALKGSLGSSLNPGDEEVHVGEAEGVNLPRVQEEGGYLIDEPPVDWDVDEPTPRELHKEIYGIDLGEDGSAIAFGDPERIDKRDILRVRSKTQLRIEYDPGVSCVSGRPTLALLPEKLPVAQLVIVPLERQSVPPSFSEQTLEHIFLVHLNPILRVANLKSILASTTRKTKRLRLTAELGQNIDNVSINGSPHQRLTANQTVIGIQGYTRDYLLMLSYVSHATSNKTEIENQIALLRSLVDSFKLIRPADVEKEQRQLRASGDRRYQRYIELTAKTMIMTQAAMLSKQWQELDWDSADSSARVISDTTLIQRAIKAFPVKDEEIDLLSLALDMIGRMPPEEMKEWIPSLDEETSPLVSILDMIGPMSPEDMQEMKERILSLDEEQP